MFHLIKDWIVEELEQYKTLYRVQEAQNFIHDFTMVFKFSTLYAKSTDLGVIFMKTSFPNEEVKLTNDHIYFQESIESDINSDKAEDSHRNTKFLETSLSLYCKLAVLLNDPVSFNSFITLECIGNITKLGHYDVISKLAP